MVALAFSPFKLTCLVAWVYLCLYSARRVPTSPLVPRPYKQIAQIVALVAGPLLFLSLIVKDASRTSKTGHPVFRLTAEFATSIS